MVSFIEMFGFGNLFNFGGMISKTLTIILIVIVGIIVIGAMYLVSRWRKTKAAGGGIQIRWWEEIHGEMTPLNIDYATEIVIPGTNLKVFYVKKRDLWLPRFTRGITKDIFFVAITPDREIVNFSIKALSKDRAEAGLIYDHTDMRWAAENTKEFIKRNYRDKATTWWKEYKELITLVAYIFIMTVSMCAILWMLSGVVKDIGNIGSTLSSAVEKLNAHVPQSSGVAPAG